MQNDVPVTGLKIPAGGDLRYTVTIPKGITYSEVMTANGTGNADLYVKYGSAPTLSSYNCRSYHAGNSELCTGSNPKPGTYYVLVHARTSVTGLTIRAQWLP